MKETNKIIGNRLKTLREAKGISQEYIANCLDVRTATISEVETGKRSIRVDLLSRSLFNIKYHAKRLFWF